MREPNARPIKHRPVLLAVLALGGGLVVAAGFMEDYLSALYFALQGVWLWLTALGWETTSRPIPRRVYRVLAALFLAVGLFRLWLHW